MIDRFSVLRIWMMTTFELNECPGCGARLGEQHSRNCDTAICWHCGKLSESCEWAQTWFEGPFLYTGGLQSVFEEHNRFYLEVCDYDYFPYYEQGKLVGLSANRVGPGPWRAIETSVEARDVIDLTTPAPELSMQSCDDCTAALLSS